MSADKLLSRLQRVKKTGPGKWMASCPTREDKSPSLAIRELDDGTVLVHDFGGEAVDAILSAVGLSMSDLFSAGTTHRSKPVSRAFNASDVLALVAFESTVAALVVTDVIDGIPVDGDDFERLITAAQRLSNAAEVCHGPR